MTDKPSAPQDFGSTLALPQTDFPMRANLPTREPGWVQRWLDEDVYGQLRARRMRDKAPVFVVHLGPPYANGNMHMGHALTYVLKDFMVRSKFMAGFDAPYVPGWDCHGLPIEWKVETELRAAGKSKRDFSTAELRGKCRAYAEHWVSVQKSEWQRFGALGDWDHPYMTMSRESESGIVRELGKMVRRGFVEKGLRSTLWSWAEETALAEAEVEYDEKHVSTAIYVALPIVGRSNEHLVIWTTTPWTLPANRAVAVAKDEEYVPVQVIRDSQGNLLQEPKQCWVAESLVSSFCKAIGQIEEDLYGPGRVGLDLVGWKYRHPLYGWEQPVVEGFHVTTDSGTGMVHIAPAHGAEDFTIGREMGLDLRCPVDAAGLYEAYVEKLPHTGVELAGRLIWDAQKDILAEIEATGRLLKAEKVVHKYPISWRSKKPLIFRSTEQWFVALDKKVDALDGKSIRERALELIHGREAEGGAADPRKVKWVPGYGENRIGSMIAGRPDWCISRQRVWGVPITIFVDKATRDVVEDEAVWDHVAALVEQEGIDAWDARIEAGKTEELFPAGWLEARGRRASDFEPVRDILDVWFDSGTTHAHVLRADEGPGQRFDRKGDGKRPADIYQEGSDQHRGWFHSSLLTSVANYNDAPYEAVVTSGFVVDGEGRKFSKSLGNGVEPRQLLEKYGMDIIRLWVASSDYSEDIRYSPQTMDAMAEAYRRFRNTFRWLLGNLNGFDETRDMVAVDALPELERYVLHVLAGVLDEVRGHYDAYQFHKAYRALYEFCGTTLSNFYFDVRKDVLYCDKPRSAERLAVQTVLVHVFRALLKALAPLMPFTTDEAWRCRYGERACVHLETFTQPDAGWRGDEAFEARWESLLAVRAQVNKATEDLRAAGGVGSNLEVSAEADVALADAELARLVCGVSALVPSPKAAVAKHNGHKCPRCWRYHGALEESGLCWRCDDAVTAMKA